MNSPVLILGATGFTGRLIAHALVQRGLRPALCARHPGRLKRLSESLGGLEIQLAQVHDRLALQSALEASLRQGGVVLNAVGPFSESADPVVDACLQRGVDYLDITGEAAVFERLAQRDREARERGVMLLPGVGFDVVPSDCLAKRVCDRAGEASWLALGIRGLDFVSRGSFRTLLEQVGQPVRVRRRGRLEATAPGSLSRSFDFGDGARTSVAVTWGDVITAWHSTGIPNIDVYFESTPAIRAALTTSRMAGRWLGLAPLQVLLKAQAEWLPEGPSTEQRRNHRCVIVAEAGDERGVRARARLHTPEAYEFTGQVAAEAARAVLGGARRSGFRTPSSALGASFVTSLPGVHEETLAS